MGRGADPSARGTIVLVTGDVVVDHHVYLGEQRTPTRTGSVRQTREWVEFGGAALVERLLRFPSGTPEPPWTVEFGRLKDQLLYPHAYAVWEPCPAYRAGERQPDVWLAREGGYGPAGMLCPSDDVSCLAGDRRGAGTTGSTTAGRALAPDHPDRLADVVVVDDAGAGFRGEPRLWPKCLAKGGVAPAWLVWKMSGDLRGGVLWQHVQASGAGASRTILVVTAADLQRGGFDVTTGLSWERSALDVLRGLATTKLRPLTACGHLVVSFPDAGALWIDRSDPARQVAKLVYQPSGGEGVTEAPGRPKAFGYQACLTAGVAWCAASSVRSGHLDLLGGLRRGLAARLRLHELGHGDVAATPPAGFPAAHLQSEALAPTPDPRTPFSDTTIPINADPGWTIVQQGITAPGPFYDTAWTVARDGLAKLRSVPSLRIGAYTTIERDEIEAIRRVRRAIHEYVDRSPQKRPLSIAVFGAPGAGKSFIVEQLARGTLGKRAPFIECNLSQFSDDRDLHGAFHLVRDAVLAGATPVVFWDEFDSQEYRWLRLLLAPMQDGKFREGQVIHPIGKSIFFFAGGTSATFEEFGAPSCANPAEAERQVRVWQTSKGPDFKGRIHAHLDVLGPNPRTRPGPRGTPEPDPTDACFPIRRALFLREKWELDDEKEEDRAFSEPLVRGLLQVREYRHGSRSLDRVLTDLARNGFPIGPESLPGAEDLERDIAGDGGARLLLASAHHADDVEGTQAQLRILLEERLDEFAERIHAAYMEHPERMRSDDVTLAYDNLSLFLRESNRAAALRIGDVLTAAGLRIVTAGSPGALSIDDGRALLESRIDDAASKEHEGWCRFHFDRRWLPTTSADEPKDTKSIPPRHPALVVWAVLSEPNRDKDRHQVRVYLQIVYDLGFAVARAPGA